METVGAHRRAPDSTDFSSGVAHLSKMD